MPSVRGRRLPLSLPRRLVGDLLAAGRRVPTVTFERRMDLSVVADARRRVSPAPAWVLLFTKAYAAVAARRPDLRRAYLPLPWPHLWEADESVAAVAVEREYRGEAGVFFGLVRGPERLPLARLTDVLREWREQPVEEVRPFARGLRYARLPLPLRRLLWWSATSLSGTTKAKNFGTFGISVTAAAGATAVNLISPVATTISYGVFASDGTLPVRLHFDHRVLDGVPVAKALAELEAELRGPIADELRAMAPADAGSPGLGARRLPFADGAAHQRRP